MTDSLSGPDAAAARRAAQQIASVQAGHMDAARLLEAIAQGVDAPLVVQEAIERVTATRDPDRLAAFSRSMARALAAA